MKKFKKIMALVIAAVMCITMAIPAMAAESDYKITVTNTNNSISIDGQVYSAYKLFDLSYNDDKTAYSYTISTSNYFYSTAGAKAVLDNYFTFTPSAGDSSVMVVEPLKTGTYYDANTKTISEAGARQLADDLQKYLASATPVKTGTASGETAVIDVGEDGYFIVTGSATPTDPKSTETVVSAVILTNAQPMASVEPKVSIPVIDKKITAVTEATASGTQTVSDAVLDAQGQAAVAKVGSTVSYEIDATTPDLRGYTDYTYIIGDSISVGLTYVEDSFVLKINNATVSIAPVFGTDKKSFTLTIPYNTLKNYDAGTAVVLTYNCTVNSNALTYDYENNTANLEYSKSPYTNETNKTPDKETYVIDLNLDVNKVANDAVAASYITAEDYEALDDTAKADYALVTDPTDENYGKYMKAGSDATKLSDAKFQLYRLAADGTTKEWYLWDTANKKVTWTTTQDDADVFETSNGALTQQVRGLDKGTYYLLETEAPAGYNLLSKPVEVTIAVAADGTSTTESTKVTYTSSTSSITNGTVDLTADQAAAQPVATTTIVNQTGSVLPSTGGIGTTMFYVIGAILVIGAGVVLVTRRRMNVQ